MWNLHYLTYIALDHIILVELHLLLSFLLSGTSSMELDDKDDLGKWRGEPKGTQLRKIISTTCNRQLWGNTQCLGELGAMGKGWGKLTGHLLWVTRK